MILAEEGTKPNKGLGRAAVTRWLGLLGIIAATAAVVLVPVVMDPSMLSTDSTRAYYQPELRALLATSVVLVVAVLGGLFVSRVPVGVPVLVPALALLGVSALSTLFSARPMHSLYGDRGEGLLSLAAEILLFYALARGLTSASRVRLFLAAAVSAAAVVSVLGIAQNYGVDPISGWGAAPFTDFGRSFSTVGNPLTLAAYLTLMMGAGTASWLGADSRARRVAWLLALAAIAACWIYAESRGAVLGVGVALPVVLLAVRRRMGTVLPLMIPAAVLVGAAAVAVAVSKASGFSTLSLRLSAVLLAYLALIGVFTWLLERGSTWLALLFPLGVLAAGGITVFAAAYPESISFADLGLLRINARAPQAGDVSLQTRLHTWRDTIPMILDRPLLGYGPDNYGESLRPYMSEELKALISDSEGNVRILNRAHSHLLQIAATTGLLGLAAYLWVLVSYFRNAYRGGGWALAALSGGVLAYVLQIQTAFPSVATDVAFWGILGASVALMRLRGREGGGLTGEVDVPPLPRSPEKEGRAQLLVGAIVVGILVSIAVPTFLQQQEKIASLERAELNIELRLAVERYERFLGVSGTRPEAGIYTAAKPIRNLNGRPIVKPSGNVTITVEATPEGEFVMQGKRTRRVGTFKYSSESATGTYTAFS